MQTVHMEIYKGYTIDICHDEFAESPREWDNLGVMVCFHDKYKLGDDDHGFIKDNYNGWDSLEDDIDSLYCLPIYMYDHGGITISTSPFQCSWDSGQVGVIYMPRKVIDDNHFDDEKAIKILESEVETYNQYLTGDVYHICIKDKKNDVLESLGGLYGLDEAIKEAKYIIDNMKFPEATTYNELLELLRGFSDEQFQQKVMVRDHNDYELYEVAIKLVNVDGNDVIDITYL